MKNMPVNNDDLWDNRELGASEEHVRKASPQRKKELDDRLGLQTISIRLQKTLIEKLKDLAESDGIKYQPYVRQLLTKHVRTVEQEEREKSQRTKPFFHEARSK